MRNPRPTSYQELQTCLRRTLVADLATEPESEPGSGPATETTPSDPTAYVLCAQWLTVLVVEP